MLNHGLARVDGMSVDEKLNKLAPSSLFAGRAKKSYIGGTMGTLVKTGKEVATASTKSVGLAGGFLKVGKWPKLIV